VRFLFAFLLALLPRLASAAETITAYESAVRVDPDGSLGVTETITVNVEGLGIRRGIYRDFPTRYTLPNGIKVSTTFEVSGVTRDGHAERWTTEALSNGVRLRIGDRDVLLAHGPHTYTIAYITRRQLYFGEGHDELYWNVTGQDWAFPIMNARAVVTAPPGAAIEDARAYTGAQGETGQDVTAERLGEGAVAFTATRQLQPGEGLTVVVTWPEGFIARPTRADQVEQTLRDNLALLVGYLGVLLVGLYFYLSWREVGKDPKGGPIIALYSPPTGVSPGAMRFLEKRGYDDKAFSAAIVNLAVKGVLKIHEQGGKRYRLEKMGAGKDLSPGEQAIADELFSGGAGEIETDRENHAIFRAARRTQEKLLAHAHENIHFVRNQKYFWIGAAITIAFAVLTFLSAAGGIANFLVPLMVGFYGIFFFALFRRFHALRVTRSIGGRIGLSVAILAVLAHAVGFGGSVLLGGVFSNFFLIVPFLMMIGLNLLFYHLLEKPTVEGRKLLDEIDGFKLYLTVAEKERLDFHTPEVTPEIFERYLPYAMALSVENKWGAKFEAAMTKAGLDAKTYQPVWYAGRGFYGSGFSSGGFAFSFGGAFTGAIAAAATPPSSGGSMGGGFAGGGGGGGGGGGW
jgi:Predicted membrane protein (DUF2207) C-terminal domain/Predicted membrane protein (DUF2207) N-terminal domain